MKTYITVTIILLLSFSIIISCRKGDRGPAGADGNTIISGAGIPSTTVGKKGDYFVDTVRQVLWGPKNDLSWGAGLALVGPDGMPGKSVLSGNGAPGASLGSTGEFYIDITTKSIYGPKTASGWGSASSLVGPQGGTGPVGPIGDTGPAGTPAQVIYSPWVTSSYPSKDTTIDFTCMRIRHLVVPSLTSDILNRG